MPLDAKQYYFIRAKNGGSVMVRRGDGAPTIQSGGPRYDLIQRPLRKSMVRWRGDDPYRMAVPILFDGWMQDKSVEGDIAKVNQMSQFRGELVAPTTVLIDGALPVKGATWVIETITWGDMVLWQTDSKGKGYRLRQDAVLNLLQFVSETALQTVKNPSATIPYRVRAGESLAMIAKVHGVSYDILKQANSIRDAKTVKTGDIILIPPLLLTGNFQGKSG